MRSEEEKLKLQDLPFDLNVIIKRKKILHMNDEGWWCIIFFVSSIMIHEFGDYIDEIYCRK